LRPALGLLLAFMDAMPKFQLHSLVASVAASLVLVCTSLPTHAGPREDTIAAENAIRVGDVVGAMATLRRLADEGYAPAQARLADLLYAAEFYGEALTLYRKAAEQGAPGGDYGLGRSYADASGVERDPARALEHYRKAAAKNHWQAFDALARAYRAGDLGLPRDLAEAQAMEQRAQSARETAEKELGPQQ
jgi:TPR repeat protein